MAVKKVVVDKDAAPSGAAFPEIRGITIMSRHAIYREGPYCVVVGFVIGDSNRDIPHYLIINTDNNVVEGSAARLFEARGLAATFAAELASQDEWLAKGNSLVQKEGEQPVGRSKPTWN